MISICLAWWVKNPSTYQHWRTHGQLLPCPDTLRKHKNCIEQEPGFLPRMFSWAVVEANKEGLKKHDRVGCLVIDEVSIQPDLTLQYKGLETRFSGQVSMTPYSDALVSERKGMDFIT